LFLFHQIVLVQSKSYTIDETSAERLFGNGRIYNSLVAKGPVIGLEFAGINCVTICQQTLNNLLQTKYQNLPRKISKKKILFFLSKKFFFCY